MTRLAPRVMSEGKFVRLLIKGGWEYVERPNCTGAVIIIALTRDGKLLFTEQERIPVGRPVIEFPAGLVGDRRGEEAEALETAAIRELLEETGYKAQRILPLAGGPTSAGLTNELVWLVQAVGLTKRSVGGGEGYERITVHEVPLGNVEAWLRRMEAQGKLVDPKVYAGLYFLKQRRPHPAVAAGRGRR
ncbi:MAG: NUDIX hydrolase [Candidatus Omnitrophota bacterium]|nr:NUDIX hydrolase [Candidatus Omnitrophota bacterium]